MITKVYIVSEPDNYNSFYGVYSSIADAEEAIFNECEDWAYEIMMTCDPMDIWGEDNWNYCDDYWELMSEGVKSFIINEVVSFVEGKD